MDFYASELWELSLDCIGLLLCGIALIQLLRIPRRSVSSDVVLDPAVADPQISAMRQLVASQESQGRAALKAFSETIRKERELLTDILDARRQGSDAPKPFEAILADAAGHEENADDRKEPEASAETTSTLPRVIQLVQSGLDVDAIHRETGIARGEIALLKAMDEQGHPFQEERICA